MNSQQITKKEQTFDRINSKIQKFVEVNKIQDKSHTDKFSNLLQVFKDSNVNTYFDASKFAEKMKKQSKTEVQRWEEKFRREIKAKNEILQKRMDEDYIAKIQEKARLTRLDLEEKERVRSEVEEYNSSRLGVLQELVFDEMLGPSFQEDNKIRPNQLLSNKKRSNLEQQAKEETERLMAGESPAFLKSLQEKEFKLNLMTQQRQHEDSNHKERSERERFLKEVSKRLEKVLKSIRMGKKI